MLVLLHPDFDEVTKIDTDPKGKFVSFKDTLSNYKVLCVYAPSEHSTREQLVRGRFFVGMQTYMENKTQGNQNKIILGDFNYAMDRKRTGILEIKKNYRFCSNFTLSKLIIDNRLEDQWRRENPVTSEFTHYDRPSGTRSRIDRVYTDIKIVNNTKINHKMISSSDHYNAITIDRPSSKTKIEKGLWHFNNFLLYIYKIEFCSTTKNLICFLKA